MGCDFEGFGLKWGAFWKGLACYCGAITAATTVILTLAG